MGMPDLVYYDASIWLAYVIKDDDYHDNANELITKTITGEHTSYVSDLIVLEVNNALTHNIIRDAGYTDSLDTERNSLASDINNIVHFFRAVLRELIHKGVVIYANPSYELGNFYKSTINCIQKVRIAEHIFPRHKHGPESAYSGYRYKGPGHWDVQHALIAQAMGCSELYTTDAGYSALEHVNEFAGLKFIVEHA